MNDFLSYKMDITRARLYKLLYKVHLRFTHTHHVHAQGASQLYIVVFLQINRLLIDAFDRQRESLFTLCAPLEHRQ